MSDKGSRPVHTLRRVAMSYLCVVLFIALVALETYLIVQHPSAISGLVITQ